MEPGATLGPYRIQRELGAGGMGRVFRAEGPEGVVALKVLHPHLFETAVAAARFEREIAIGRTVDHPNVVRTFGGGRIGRHHYLAMEYVEGQTLDGLLQDLGRVPEELCRHIGREMCRGLAAIHAAGAVHRDVKPENALITPDHVVKIMDLGVARSTVDTLRLSQTAAFVGSLRYAAPEQLGGSAGVSGKLDGRADLHALGLVLYELASAERPFHADDGPRVLHNVLTEEPPRLGKVNPQLSAFFEEVVHRLLAKDPDQRFRTADELLGVLAGGEQSTWWLERARELQQQTRRPVRRVRLPRETAVLGREAELDTLRTLHDQAKSGQGRVVLVEGEAGIGKTRLIDELVTALRADGEDLNFLFASAATPGAFRTAYRDHLGATSSAEYLPETPLLVAAFDALLNGRSTPAGAEPLTRQSLQTVFVMVTRALATERPTILLIDDLHLASEEDLGLFTALARAVPGHRLLLAGTTRPRAAATWVREIVALVQTSRIVLARVGPADVERLIATVLGSEHLATELAPRVMAKSAGNPLFVLEILRELRSGSRLRETAAGHWERAGPIDGIEIPSSVTDLVRARLESLEREDRDLLAVAACCGFGFDPQLVCEAAGFERLPMLRRLADIERVHRVVRSVGRRVAFDHPQLRETLYEDLHPLLREAHHAAVGDALERREGAAGTAPEDLDGGLCADLCEHFLAGACGDRALRYLEPALDHLESGFVNDRAIALTELVLGRQGLVTGERRVRLLLRRADRLALRGRRDEERDALDEALELAQAHGDDALLSLVGCAVGWHVLHGANFRDAEVPLRDALERARRSGARHLEVVAQARLGTVMNAMDRHDESHDRYRRAIALATETGDRRALADVTGNLGAVFHSQGRYDEAREHFERSLALARQEGHRLAAANATGNLGAVFHEQGHLDEAAKHQERKLVLSRELGDRQGEAVATGNLGNVYWSLGRYADAYSSHARQLVLAREIGDAQTEGIALFNLGHTLVRMGDPAAGAEQLRAALALCGKIGFSRLGARAALLLARLPDPSGDPVRTEQSLDEAIERLRGVGDRDGLAAALTSLGQVLVEDGRNDEARTHLAEALAVARAVESPGQVVLAACVMARLPGEPVCHAREATAQYAGRLDVDDSMEARFHLWKGDSDPADLAQAHELLQSLRDRAPVEYRDAILEKVPLHRDIVAAWAEHGGGRREG